MGTGEQPIDAVSFYTGLAALEAGLLLAVTGVLFTLWQTAGVRHHVGLSMIGRGNAWLVWIAFGFFVAIVSLCCAAVRLSPEQDSLLGVWLPFAKWSKSSETGLTVMVLLLVSAASGLELIRSAVKRTDPHEIGRWAIENASRAHLARSLSNLHVPAANDDLPVTGATSLANPFDPAVAAAKTLADRRNVSQFAEIWTALVDCVVKWTGSPSEQDRKPDDGNASMESWLWQVGNEMLEHAYSLRSEVLANAVTAGIGRSYLQFASGSDMHDQGSPTSWMIKFARQALSEKDYATFRDLCVIMQEAFSEGMARDNPTLTSNAAWGLGALAVMGCAEPALDHSELASSQGAKSVDPGTVATDLLAQAASGFFVSRVVSPQGHGHADAFGLHESLLATYARAALRADEKTRRANCRDCLYAADDLARTALNRDDGDTWNLTSSLYGGFARALRQFRFRGSIYNDLWADLTRSLLTTSLRAIAQGSLDSKGLSVLFAAYKVLRPRDIRTLPSLARDLSGSPATAADLARFSEELEQAIGWSRVPSFE